MEFDFKRAGGYILMGIGLFLIFYSIYLAYSVFMGISEPPRLYVEPSYSADILKAQNLPGEQTAQKIDMPKGFFEKTVNLSSFGILLFLFIMAGGKLAEVGAHIIS